MMKRSRHHRTSFTRDTSLACYSRIDVSFQAPGSCYRIGRRALSCDKLQIEHGLIFYISLYIIYRDSYRGANIRITAY